MAWIARSLHGELYIFSVKPDREAISWICKTAYIELPPKTDKKLIGRHLTWEDEPVEI